MNKLINLPFAVIAHYSISPEGIAAGALYPTSDDNRNKGGYWGGSHQAHEDSRGLSAVVNVDESLNGAG
jgi:hypothetical protein